MVIVALVAAPSSPVSSGGKRLIENASDGRFSSLISMSAVICPSSNDKTPFLPDISSIGWCKFLKQK